MPDSEVIKPQKTRATPDSFCNQVASQIDALANDKLTYLRPAAGNKREGNAMQGQQVTKDGVASHVASVVGGRSRGRKGCLSLSLSQSLSSFRLISLLCFQVATFEVLALWRRAEGGTEGGGGRRRGAGSGGGSASIQPAAAHSTLGPCSSLTFMPMKGLNIESREGDGRTHGRTDGRNPCFRWSHKCNGNISTERKQLFNRGKISNS